MKVECKQAEYTESTEKQQGIIAQKKYTYDTKLQGYNKHEAKYK